jgi:hypothetical protein
LKCVICGKSRAEGLIFGLDLYICSQECQKEFDRRVEEIFKQRHGNLIGKSLVLDPAVGDEYEIARISAKSRIEDELSRSVRLQELRENMRKLALSPELAEHLTMLNESAVGSNTVDIMINDVLYTVYFDGFIKPTKGYGYYWKRVPNGWQEVRDDEYQPRFLRDEDMRFPHYGDVEGASAITVIEHHATPEDIEKSK